MACCPRPADSVPCLLVPAEVVREVGLLVYDEVHYLRDTERGVVWEESIILAPKATRMAFLSATLPNSAEFAGWVAATHGSPVHVVYTEYRPTPLQHYMFPAGGLVTTVLLFVASCFCALLEARGSCVLQDLCQLVCAFQQVCLCRQAPRACYNSIGFTPA